MLHHPLQHGEMPGYRAGDYQRENHYQFEAYRANQSRYAEAPNTLPANTEEVKAIIDEREACAERLVEIHRLRIALAKERTELSVRMSQLQTNGWQLVGLPNYDSTYRAIYGVESSGLAFSRPSDSKVREYNELIKYEREV